MIRLTITSILFFFVTQTALSQQVLIVYHSETGNTERMARSVAEGARSVEGAEVLLLSVDEVTNDDMIESDAIIVGSPVYNANVTPEISKFIASWPFEGQPLKDKIGAAFVTAGGISAGEELVQMNILQSMLIFGMIVVGGPDWTQPFGASAVTGESPFEVSEPDEIADQFKEKGFLLGERIAKIVLKMREME
ncbi:flavodoxin family protein [Rhodohalobacter sp.]|uniref:flavodoxin family protein n=1 Tax=Rhodohalobacter sp. TaxID=1974210 RepID=UPI002ACDAEF5|nr:flavodoxin family protein [Rhodohalobacter sp.]MDZ7758315.1 flavodoxin family protein [Rhodohalobacter sp.]